MSDRYTKSVLTIIAAALIALVVEHAAPSAPLRSRNGYKSAIRFIAPTSP